MGFLPLQPSIFIPENRPGGTPHQRLMREKATPIPPPTAGKITPVQCTTCFCWGECIRLWVSIEMPSDVKAQGKSGGMPD